ncbi:zinc finger protein 271-like isoform X1 [Alosa sapidissima]|uniref:zinc finger protein 271-like isoform X1 n=2 Tax=Alosa sapidissima TaxID=34773 RepID=UPI001C082D59|nr:zinc finger protein 271-like isoform X1 [Alosa sapidissima]
MQRETGQTLDIKIRAEMELEVMVDHSEVYPAQDTEFKIVEVFSMDNLQSGASNTVTEVVIEEESDSDTLVVDHDFGFGAPHAEYHADSELHSAGQPVKKRRRQPQQKLFCPICGKMCMSISGLKVHQKMHTRDSSLDCNICNMTFPSQAAQSAHMAMHNPEKTHQCPCCPLRFASDRALQGHFRVHHKGSEMMMPRKKQGKQRKPQLPPSPQRTPSPPSGHFSQLPPMEHFSQSPPRSVKRQSKKKHKTPSPAQLLLPELPEPQIVKAQKTESRKGKQGTGYRNREKIKLAKLNRKAFLQASPVQQASYLQQVIEESRKPVPAQKAGGPDRNGTYRCNICKKIFRELHFLEKHIVVHMAVRLHKCSMCSESFDSARALNAHESEVHDQGQYVCSICGKNLHKLGSLLNHQLLHEKKGAKTKARSKKSA